MNDKYVKIYGIVSLIYIFVGFHLLRKIFDNIVGFSATVREKIGEDIAGGMVGEDQSELQQIVQSFNTIETQLRVNTELLTRRSSEVTILKELSDICYVTLDPWEIFYVTLERALLMAKADKGSALIPWIGRTTSRLLSSRVLALVITLK